MSRAKSLHRVLEKPDVRRKPGHSPRRMTCPWPVCFFKQAPASREACADMPALKTTWEETCRRLTELVA